MMGKVKTYIYNTLIGLLCLGCTPAIDTVFAPNGLYKSCDNGNLYVSDAASKKVLCLSDSGEIIMSSPELSEKVNDLIVDNDKITLLCGGFNGKIILLDSETLELIEQKVIGHTPNSIISDNNRNLYWVALRHEGDLIAIDKDTKEEKQRIDIGREPIDIISFDNGKSILIANNLPEQSSLSFPVASALRVVNIENGEMHKFVLPNGSTDVKSIALDKNGDYAYITHLLARYQLPTNQVDRGWMSTNVMTIFDLKKECITATVLLDSPQRGAANPWEIIVSDDNKHIITALSGSHELAVINRDSLHSRLAQYEKGIAVIPSSKNKNDIINDASFLYGIRDFIPTGGNGTRSVIEQRGMLYAANYFSGDIIRLNIKNISENSKVEQFIKGDYSLSKTGIGEGEMYFHDAKLCYQEWQSCASCHPNDARTDGMNWDLLNDGMGNLKNTKSLLYSHQTPPSMVTGIRANAETAVRSGFKHILFAKVDKKKALAVDNYLMSLHSEKSPYLTENGNLSESALRGKENFDKYCLSCHSGAYYTNMKQYDIAWSNGSEKGKKMDVPTLVETWRSAPYLYDGRAYTMCEILKIHIQHESLSSSELQDLEEYILSL